MHEVSVGVMSAAGDVRPVLSMAPPRCEIGRWGELSDGIDVEITGIFLHIFSISISDTFLRFRFDLVIHWDRISNKLISYP